MFLTSLNRLQSELMALMVSTEHTTYYVDLNHSEHRDIEPIVFSNKSFLSFVNCKDEW